HLVEVRNTLTHFIGVFVIGRQPLPIAFGLNVFGLRPALLVTHAIEFVSDGGARRPSGLGFLKGEPVVLEVGLGRFAIEAGLAVRLWGSGGALSAQGFEFLLLCKIIVLDHLQPALEPLRPRNILLGFGLAVFGLALGLFRDVDGFG